MNERDVVLATLRRLARRLRVNRSLAEAASATSVLLGFWLGLTVLELRSSLPVSARNALLGLLFAAWAGWLISRLARREPLARAAEVADRQGGLKDELKTALWLISCGSGSPWVEAQVRRAATTARRLDPTELVPLRLPRAALLAGVLLLGLGLVVRFAPDGSVPGFGAAPALSEEETAKIEDIKNLLRESARLKEEEEGLEDLQKSLLRLEQGDVSRDEALRELRRAADALAERELDSAALRDELARLGEGLRGAAELAALAEALKQGRLQEAADLLRSLAEKSDKNAHLKDLLEQLARSSSRGNAGLDSLLSKLREAAERARSDPRAARESLEAAAATLDALATQMAGEMRLGEAGRQLQLLGGMMQASEALAGESERISGPGEPGGGSTGPPGGAGEKEQPLSEPTRLAVQLEIERLSARKKADEPEPREITHEATREERSRLEYRSVGEGLPYAEAEPMTAEPIPWRHRQLVRDYFLTLRPGAEK